MNGDVFTGDRDQPHYRPGAVAIKDSVIVGVGPESEILSVYESAQKIDARGALVHPGFIETHLHMTAMAYHGAPFSPHSTAATKVNYSTLKSATNPTITAAYTAAAACSMLQRGFTLFFEAGTVFETDAFAESMTKCGVRAMVSAPFAWDDLSTYEELWPHMMPDALKRRAPADAGRVIDQWKHEIARNKDENALVHGYVGLYGEATATDELTREAVKLAAESKAIFGSTNHSMPSSMSKKRKSGAIPVQYVWTGWAP
ncbi:amidohydrolase family protein [Mesorhizobium sp. C374B]|uniref:amidohydrolase family protein n=1 Tax=Mesorhizobium sp. C374B TaxID=2956830 RepID=UPI0025783F22|nr:amidohydrolase family protein [Mesorhizobium sp. C374B]WJI80977.1 amidohydrolase family protein [Mesorhizobium sp. C374B]